MNYPAHIKKQDGQALIELIIVAPLLLLIFCSLVGLIAYSQLPIWMDELLSYTLISQNSSNHFEVLEKRRKNSVLPQYFQNNELDIQKIPVKDISIPYPLHKTFQNNRFRVTGNANWGKLMSRTSLPLIHTLKGIETYTSEMSFLSFKELNDQKAAELVKGAFLLGIPDYQIMKLFRKLGFKMFHLNFDILPLTKPKKESTYRDQ